MLLKPVTLPFSDLKPELDRWKRDIGMEESFWFGRASTGMIAALKIIFSLFPERKKVLVPALGCTSIANTVLLAGGVPVFVDVEPTSGVMDAADLRKKIDPECASVIFVALYGNLTDPAPFLHICRNNGLILIEDGAQALGGRWTDGTPIGGIGDFAVFSFNPTKIVESGGGVLFCRSSKHAALLPSVLENWQIRDQEPDDSTGLMMRDLQMGMAEAMKNRIHADFHTVYVKTVLECEHLYAVPCRVTDGGQWLKAWKSLDGNLSRRARMTVLYLDGLRPDRFTPITGRNPGSAVWRHSVLTPDTQFQRSAVAALRRNGLLASTHYWALPGYYTDRIDACPHALFIADRVLNLWVDSKVGEDTVHRTIDILNHL